MSDLDASIHAMLSNLGWPAEGVVQLLLAAVAGGLVGIERELRGRQAGFRTNLLVCVGSALVMIVSVRMTYAEYPLRDDVVVNVDPSRIAYGVMTGIGFLGAGAIIKNGASVRGLTTAAGLWCVAAMGMAVGIGLYVLMLASCLLILVSLWLLDHFEGLLPRLHYREVVVRRRWEPGCVSDTVTRMKAAGLQVNDASFERTADLQSVDICLRIAFADKEKYYAVERHLIQDQTHELISVRE